MKRAMLMTNRGLMKSWKKSKESMWYLSIQAKKVIRTMFINCKNTILPRIHITFTLTDEG